jgi:2-oxoglutarate ferredoxin oxidoreductase subunit beta
MKTKTSPHGSWLEPLNPLTITLGVSNVSFVAQCPDWMPDLLEQLIAQAHAHHGFSFVRILQRCPNFLPHLFDAYIRTPSSCLVLEHPQGLSLSDDQKRAYRQRTQHDPADLERARSLAADTTRMPVGVLYRNDAVPCYEDLRKSRVPHDVSSIASVLERELDSFAAE